jgi:diguanylate cyclase (GGDEF)-like protein
MPAPSSCCTTTGERTHKEKNHTMNSFMIDMPTVLFFLFFGNAITTVLLAIYPVDTVSRRTYRQILAGKMLQSIAWILLAMRGNIPDIYSANVGNSFLLAGFALEALAMISVDEPKKQWEVFYTIIVSLFMFVFWVFAQKANQYVYISSWFSAIIFLSVAILLLYGTHKSILRYVLSVVYIFSCLVLLIRGMNAYHDTDFKLMSHNSIQDVVFLSTYSLMILSGTSFLLLMRERTDRLLRESNLDLDKLAHVDGLTNLANRRMFDKYLVFSILQHHREAEPLTLIMIDIDYFKKYNDLYGHSFGDRCLVEVAQKIKHCCCRSTDLVSRYGGEEFAVILWNTDDAGAYLVAEAIRQGIADLALPHATSDVSEYVTLSLGIFSAVPVSDKHNSEWYIVESDRRLYDAKRAGRNRCVRTEETV